MYDSNTVSRLFVNFFFCSMIISLFSCSESQEQKRIIMEDPKETKDLEGQLNNPMLFLGTTFGHFLQAGQYEQMFLFTSNLTKELYSKRELTEFYRNMQFSYPLQLKSYTIEGNQFTLRYETSIVATVKTIQMLIVIENDTCRLVLYHLDLKSPFIGI
jgi:hypothetical protein